MNRITKLITILVAVCMLVSAMPAQFASAGADDIDTYVKGQVSSLSNVPEDYSGHIWHLQPATESEKANFDYKLTVYGRNLQGTHFITSLKYNKNDVSMITNDNDHYEYDPQYDDTISAYFSYGTVLDSMVSNADLVGSSTSGTVFAIPDTSDSFAGEDGDYYTVTNSNRVNTNIGSRDFAKYTNAETGAKFELDSVNNVKIYTFPSKVNVEMFTLYFKMLTSSGKSKPDENTFKINYDESNQVNGGSALTTVSTGAPKQASEGVYMVGFPEKELDPVSVSFKVQGKNSANLSGATVTLYEDAERTNQVGTASTESDGTATITNVPASSNTDGKKYYYTITAANYQEKKDEVTVKTSNVDAGTITLTSESDVTYPAEITVLDKDTGEPISGAEVFINGAKVTQDDSTEVTGANGKITGKATATGASKHKVTATHSDYQTLAESDAAELTVTTSGGSTTVYLTPNRVTSPAMPTISDKNGVISGAKYTITKISDNKTDEWGTSKPCAAGSTIELPKNTKFKVVSEVAGYSQTTLYMSSDGSTAKLYTDSACTQAYTESGVTIIKLDDPMYVVTIKPTDADPNTYTAVVTLQNINAETGAFGLRYDKELFDFDAATGFEINTEDLKLYAPDATGLETGILTETTTNGADDTIAYHAFTWKAKDENNGGATFDTTAGAKTVATYTFKLKANKSAIDIRSGSFGVMPYDKTAMAAAYINEHGCDEATEDLLSMLWRECDEENSGTLGSGRLDASKAADNGFFQAYAVPLESDENPVFGMSDVMTKLDFESNGPSLVFEADDNRGMALKDVEITVTKDGKDEKLKTDLTGMAIMEVDPSKSELSYSYTAKCLGYWDVTDGSVTIPMGETETTYESMVLEEKIYHPLELRDKENTAVTTAKLSGGTYAYNNRDYWFNIVPNAGYTFDPLANPTLIAQIDGTDVNVSFNKAANAYLIPKASITGEKTNTTPDENGFPSDKIIIKIPNGKIEPLDDKYTVKAMAGKNGTVTYGAEITGDVSENTSEDGVKTITVSNVEPNADTDTFTFTANDGYKVEKVIINGSEIMPYKGLTGFTYKFENVTQDNTIAVLFGSETDPSTDTIVTLTVGDRGKADVTSPITDSGIRKETRTYIYTQETANRSLAFNATPDTDYNLDPVYVSVDGGEKTEVSGTDGSYTVPVNTANRTVDVYVSFHYQNESPFTVFVNSYVKEGMGKIEPIGVLAYSKNEKPIYTMTAEPGGDWMYTGVDVDGKETEYSQAPTGTYQYEPLTKDSKIGAIFSETAYMVYGSVDLSQGKNLTTLEAQTPAKVYFTRTTDGKTFETQTTRVRTNATFEKGLPLGEWTVAVKKQGYLDYEITGFKVEVNDGQTEIYFGAAAGQESTGPCKKIVPIIGNTNGKGNVVSLLDVGVVGAGLRTGANSIVRSRADVDDDGETKVEDMAYINANYGCRKITQTYEDFKAN